MTSLDPITQAWLVGFFSCLMTAFPVAMLLLLPHDGWGRYIPSKESLETSKKIRDLENKLFLAETEAKLAQSLLEKKNG